MVEDLPGVCLAIEADARTFDRAARMVILLPEGDERSSSADRGTVDKRGGAVTGDHHYAPIADLRAQLRGSQKKCRHAHLAILQGFRPDRNAAPRRFPGAAHACQIRSSLT